MTSEDEYGPLILVDSDGEEIEEICISEKRQKQIINERLERQEKLFEQTKEDPWTYFPKYIEDEKTFDRLYSEVENLVQEYMVRAPFKSELYPSKRKSATFMAPEIIKGWKDGSIKRSDEEKKRANQYAGVPSLAWNQSKELTKIKNKLEKDFDIKFGYALIHLYRDGTDTLNYHADREATKGNIFSLSLGATRKFRFRKQNQKIGFYKEYNLQNGDMVVMHPRCQHQFLHGVPVEKKIKGPRINCTFRFYQ